MAEEETDPKLEEGAGGTTEGTEGGGEGGAGTGGGDESGKQVVSLGKYQRETRALKEQIEALKNPKPEGNGESTGKPAVETSDLGALSKELAELKAELASRDLDKALTKALGSAGVSDTDLAATYLLAKGAKLKDGALEGVDLEALKTLHPSLFAPEKKGSSGPKPGGAMGGKGDLDDKIDRALHLR